MNIGFFVRHFTERGTEVAIYDYAKYNEDILNNKSYIICFTQETQEKINFPMQKDSYDKFNKRFTIIEITDINDMINVIKKYELSFFYTLTGGANDFYQFNNKNIWGNCKTIKHCVFYTNCPESDFYISISDMLNQKNNTNINVIPHIVDLPISDENLRSELEIPRDANVFGRYGGFDEFNINIAHNAIQEYINLDNNCYFLFMNTKKFYEHPRIIYIDKNLDLDYKVKFINTCDAMIHARQMGETFGLSIAEFSTKNKPIITCNCGDLEHINILGDKAILYNSKDELINIFKNIKSIINSRSDWNAYKLYSPEYVMNLFKKNIFDTITVPSLGFIILRNVNSEETNKYWIRCYNSIRKFYPENNILIIDDNSNLNYLTNEALYKTTLINSEFPGRGELLPYYYYLQNKLFDVAVIFHDSVFIQQKINFDIDKYKIIWTFEHYWDLIEDETKMIKSFKDDELYEFYKNKSMWNGCFGGMSIITHDYLMHINNKYDISKLLDFVLNKTFRMAFERVIGCLLEKEYNTKSLLGNIHAYCPWNISFKNIDRYKELPLLKVWTGR